MKLSSIILFFVVVSVSLFARSGLSQNANVAVNQLSTQWADITYATPGANHRELFEALYQQSQGRLNTEPQDAELLAWAGIITASYASAKGGLNALKLAKQAKSYLEAAMRLDPEALNGGARTSLGVLYQKVPPWPVGFGNKKTAAKLLEESHQKHPENMDVLYFYADYLLSENNTAKARQVFQRAAELPVRSYRAVADTGRQNMIQEKLTAIRNSTS